MSAEEKNIYEIQTVKMCIKTYFNLHGVMPGTEVIIDWLGEAYAKVIPLCMNETAAA